MKKFDEESLARRDKGTILAILDRFNKQRLHRARAMQIKVNSEELLNERDLELIRKVKSETWLISRLAERNPQYMELASKIFQMWIEIIEKDIQNRTRNK